MKRFYGTTILSACLALSTSYGAQITLNQNLLVNPGAESGTGSASGNDLETVPGWTTTGTFTVVQYGAAAAPVAVPGPGFGNNFFSGGLQSDFLQGTPGGPTESDQASQTIDLSSIASLIDTGVLGYSLSGWFGGYLGQNDNASMFATFYNGSNAVIGTSQTIGGENSTSRHDLSALVPSSTGTFVPVGARSVQITLVMTKVEGYYDDGYADNLSFELVPEPSTWALAVLGLLGLGFARRRGAYSQSTR